MYEAEAVAAWDGRQAYCQELALIRRHLHKSRLEQNHEERYNLLISYFAALSARMVPKKGDEQTPMFTRQEQLYEQSKNAYRQYKKDIIARGRTGGVDCSFLELFNN